MKLIIAAVLSLALGAAGFAAAPGLSGRIVLFRDGAPLEGIRAELEAAGCGPVRELKAVNGLALRLSPFCTEGYLKSMPGAVLVAADAAIRLERDPALRLPPDVSGTAGEQPWRWNITRLNLPAAWKTARGRGVRVAVLDTGIDPRHPDLAPNVAGGYNAIRPGASWEDDMGHGTSMAGIIAAVQNPERSMAGVAPEASLYAVKVMDSNGEGALSDIAAGIDWAIQNKMQVISMSISYKNDDAEGKIIHEEIRKAVAAGIVVVSISGNMRVVTYPGAYPEVIGVAGSDPKDQRFFLSGRGPEVDLIAPAVWIRETRMGGGYTRNNGVSEAGAHVAGLAALKLSQSPGLSPEEVRAALIDAATPLPDLSAEDQGAGMVDAARLVGR